VSLVVELKDMVEAAMVGHDGVVNAATALDGRVALNKAIVQSGGFLAVVPVPIVVAVADQDRELRSLPIRHEQVLLCNRSNRARATRVTRSKHGGAAGACEVATWPKGTS
jgi:hypothetical protein